MRKFLIILVLLILSAVGLHVAAPHDLPNCELSSPIVFQSPIKDVENKLTSSVMLANGHELLALTDEDSLNTLPISSPDGQWIAFISDRSGSAQAWIVPVTGGPATQISDVRGENVLTVDWIAGNPMRLIYVVQGERSTMTIASLEGETLSAASIPMPIEGLTVNKQGTKIAFVTRSDGDFSALNVIEPTFRPLFSTESDFGDTQNPVWSPDGTLLAFFLQTSTVGSGQFQTWVRSFISGDEWQVGPAIDSSVVWPDSWSPASTELLLTVRKDSWDVLKADMVTGYVTTFANSKEQEMAARWSPDGSQIMYLWTPEGIGDSNIVISNQDSSDGVCTLGLGTMPSWVG